MFIRETRVAYLSWDLAPPYKYNFFSTFVLSLSSFHLNRHTQIKALFFGLFWWNI